jgi:3-oxoacyl-[acyl-carrier-protein] synthase-3
MASRPELAPLAVTTAPPAAVRTAGILGLGAALPPAVVGNEAIASRIGVEPSWIVRRTGIESRRHIGAGERLTDLAALAGRRALDDAGLDASELDLVVVATISQDELTPACAPLVALALGADGAGAFDLGSACSGFVSALGMTAGYIESGRVETALVVGADAMSRFTDPDDRRTAALFGDGAGAVVLSASGDGRVGPVVLGADGAAGPFITIERDDALIRMDGHETFKRAVRHLAESSEQAVSAAGLTLRDVDLFVYHQANRRILGSLVEMLGLDPDRVVDAIAEVGNTSAGSVPLALEQARLQGRLEPGARVLLGAVGAGFSWATAVVEWGGA